MWLIRKAAAFAVTATEAASNLEMLMKSLATKNWFRQRMDLVPFASGLGRAKRVMAPERRNTYTASRNAGSFLFGFAAIVATRRGFSVLPPSGAGSAPEGARGGTWVGHSPGRWPARKVTGEVGKGMDAR